EGELGFSRFDYDSISGSGTATYNGTTYAIGGSASVDGTVTGYSGMVNAVVSPFGKSALRPYIGLGIGAVYSVNEVDKIGTLTTNTDESEAYLAAQGLLGIDYRIDEKLSIGAQYRYAWVDSGDDVYGDLTAHAALANLAYRF
ncbi:MAG: outer membrane protein, partial [Rhodospirillales bacterium]